MSPPSSSTPTASTDEEPVAVSQETAVSPSPITPPVRKSTTLISTATIELAGVVSSPTSASSAGKLLWEGAKGSLRILHGFADKLPAPCGVVFEALSQIVDCCEVSHELLSLGYVVSDQWID